MNFFSRTTNLFIYIKMLISEKMKLVLYKHFLHKPYIPTDFMCLFYISWRLHCAVTQETTVNHAYIFCFTIKVADFSELLFYMLCFVIFIFVRISYQFWELPFFIYYIQSRVFY